MTDPNMIAASYLDVWNADDDAHRRVLIRKTWSDEATYVDPLMQGDGRDGIASMIESARTQFPGHSFTLRGHPDGHGDHVRFSWTLAPDGGAAVAAGTDMVRLDRDGLIAEVVGFLDGASQ